jgi:hypothetical protein
MVRQVQGARLKLKSKTTTENSVIAHQQANTWHLGAFFTD